MSSTALCFASNNLEMAKLLLDRGADVNAQMNVSEIKYLHKSNYCVGL